MSVNEKMTALADAIREKSGVTGKLTIDGMTSAVKAISSLIVASASGNPIVLNDSTDLRVQSLRLFGKTTQDGIPTPEAPVPLVSAGDGGSLGVKVTGKNLLDLLSPIERKNNNIPVSAITEEKPNSLQITGATSYAWSFIGYTYKLLPGTYTISAKAETDGDTNVVWVGVRQTLGGSTVKQHEFRNGGSVSFTVTEETPYANIRFHLTAEAGTNGETWTTRYYDLQLEAGSTATAYEPYKEPQDVTIQKPTDVPVFLPGIPVTSGGNYTDETGQQWLCDEVDFGRGVYVQRVIKAVFDGSNDEYWVTSGTTDSNSPRMGTEIYNDIVSGNSDIREASNGLCTHYKLVPANSYGTYGCNEGISIGYGGTIHIYDAEYTAVNDWKAYLAVNPVTCLFQLAAPIETHLSEIDPDALAQYATLHTNYPNTTILNDGGAGMEVSYVADTKLYIDNKINAMAAAIVNA